MQTYSYKYPWFIIPTLLLYFNIFLPQALATPPKSILILPIDLHAENDLAYLKQGITDMLVSRLSQEEKITIISNNLTEKTTSEMKSPLTQAQALKFGKELKADYVIFGSVTLFGESISTDTRMLEVQTGRTVVQFNQTGQSRSELIPHIDAFANQIKSEVFALSTSPPVEKAEAQTEDLHQHPDKLIHSPSTPSEPVLTQRLISRKYKLEIRGLAAGDVTGDGQKEIVLIDRNSIIIYRPIKDSFQRIGEIKEKAFNNFLTVDVADINHNGKAEIFVSNLPNNSNRMQSFVIEYDGKTYHRVADRQPVFFRTLQAPDGSKSLITQAHENNIVTSGDNQIFKGEVLQTYWKNGEYVPKEALFLPRGGNVLNFAKGDVIQTSEETTVQYSDSKVLKVFNSSGKEEWSAEDSFGSQATYLELPDSQDMKQLNRIYLPTRIFTVDVNRDGKLDIMAINNQESLGSVSRLKIFKNGRLICLSWDGLNFQEIWQTDTVRKFISDFAVTDLMGQGQLEVIYAVVAKEKSNLQNGQSYIVRQPFSAVNK